MDKKFVLSVRAEQSQRCQGAEPLCSQQSKLHHTVSLL